MSFPWEATLRGMGITGRRCASEGCHLARGECSQPNSISSYGEQTRYHGKED